MTSYVKSIENAKAAWTQIEKDLLVVCKANSIYISIEFTFNQLIQQNSKVLNMLTTLVSKLVVD